MACRTPAALADIGIELAAIGAQFERESLEKVKRPFDQLLSTLAQKSDALARRV